MIWGDILNFVSIDFYFFLSNFYILYIIIYFVEVIIKVWKEKIGWKNKGNVNGK